ncbi:MAG: phosphate ABC transporter ATP-binding protein [Nevskiales bacterium]
MKPTLATLIPNTDHSAVCDTALQVRDLGLAYRGRWAFRNVSLDIPQNRITALIGPSGCGKTSFLTALNRLSDLVPGCAVEGQMLFCCEDIRNWRGDVTPLRRRIGMIFQKPNPFPLSIRRNIELALIDLGIRVRSRREDIIERVLREVGLWDEVRDRLHTAAQSLSGGQQQRLCIARALALEPDVLLMDEPCSALDPISSAVVEELILRLKTRYTMVVVTHNLQQARRIADQTGVFWTEDGIGKLVEYGPTHQVFTAARDARAAAYVDGRRG